MISLTPVVWSLASLAALLWHEKGAAGPHAGVADNRQHAAGHGAELCVLSLYDLSTYVTDLCSI